MLSRCTTSSKYVSLPSTCAILSECSPLMRSISSLEKFVSPRAISAPPASTIATVLPRAKRPETAVTPAGSSDLRRSTIARSPPASIVTLPLTLGLNAIHFLLPRMRRRAGTKKVPTSAPSKSAARSAVLPLAMITPTPLVVAMRAARSLDSMPPSEKALPLPRANSNSRSSTRSTVPISSACGSVFGSAL